MTDLAVAVDLKQKWQRVSHRLRAELGDDLFTSWFGRMDAEDCCNLKLIVSVPTRFLKSWIENHYVAKLQKIAETEFGRLDAVQVRVRGQITPPRAVEMAERPVEKPRTSYEEPRGAIPSANFLQQGMALAPSTLGTFMPYNPLLTFAIPWPVLAIIDASALLATLLATILPAWQASRIPPAQALRYE